MDPSHLLCRSLVGNTQIHHHAEVRSLGGKENESVNDLEEEDKQNQTRRTCQTRLSVRENEANRGVKIRACEREKSSMMKHGPLRIATLQRVRR